MALIDEIKQLLQGVITPDLAEIKADVKGISRQMDYLIGRVDRIEADLREFYRTLGQHDAKIEGLEKGQ